MKKNGSKGIYAAALILFLGGLGYLVVSGLGENSSYFLNVSEAMAMEPGKLHKVRLFGTVAADGLKSPEGGLGVKFKLEDKDNTAKTLWVDFKGAVPDTFKPGAEVIVEGGFDSASGVFGANTLMTKCPSKYEKQNREKTG